MKIIQILKDDRTIYGLGEDSHVYRWSYEKGDWEPYWDIRTEEQKMRDGDAIRNQSGSNGGGNIAL